MPPVPYTDVLARNLRAARAVADIGQADLAARMNALGFPEWRRQTAARAEKGTRRITAAEAAALAICLDTTVSSLMVPRDDEVVVFPSGITVTGIRLLSNDHSVTWDQDNKPVLSEPSGPDTAALAARGAEKLMQQLVEKLTRDGWTPPQRRGASR